MWSRGLVSLALGLGLSGPAWGKQVAVVVGLSSYGNLPDELHLESARDDARARSLRTLHGVERRVSVLP